MLACNRVLYDGMLDGYVGMPSRHNLVCCLPLMQSVIVICVYMNC
jgi:hypothetical protein